MRYSVFDYRKGKFDYYDAVGDVPATGSFRSPVGGLHMPEVIAARLPSGATLVGSGDTPIGTIATTPAVLGALEIEGKKPVSVIPFVVVAAALIMLWGRR